MPAAAYCLFSPATTALLRQLRLTGRAILDDSVAENAARTVVELGLARIDRASGHLIATVDITRHDELVRQAVEDWLPGVFVHNFALPNPQKTPMSYTSS